MILFIENANKHTHTHTQFSTDGEFSKVTEYKNLIHEWIVFYILTRNEKLKNEIEKVILFTITSKKNKKLSNKLNKIREKLIHLRSQNVIKKIGKA